MEVRLCKYSVLYPVESNAVRAPGQSLRGGCLPTAGVPTEGQQLSGLAEHTATACALCSSVGTVDPPNALSLDSRYRTQVDLP